MAAGVRFFCSRMGVKDWAKAIEEVSASASGTCLNCMGARVANSWAFAKSTADIRGLARIRRNSDKEDKTGLELVVFGGLFLADLVVGWLVVLRA